MNNNTEKVASIINVTVEKQSYCIIKLKYHYLNVFHELRKIEFAQFNDSLNTLVDDLPRQSLQGCKTCGLINQ